MDQLIRAFLSHTHYWYEVGMSKVTNMNMTLRRSRILFAEFLARMEDTRLPKCVMFREMVGGAG